MKKYIKLMRCHHYIKNVLVFLPVVFSKNITNIDLLIKVCLGAISFCLLSSTVYIMNDIKDIEVDRKNEKKKNRPLASGAISIKNAIILAVFIFI